MRNLRNISYSTWSAPSDITATCWDAVTDETLAVCGPSEAEAEIQLFRITGQNSPSSQL